MNKTWIIFKHEYLRHVKRKRFIFAILSMPFFVLFIVAIAVITAMFSADTTPIGYIDQSGYFDNAIMPEFDSPAPFRKPMQIIRYTDETQARQALENNEIQAIYLINPDYLESGNVNLIANHIPDSDINWDFADFLQLNLLKDIPETISNRIVQGSVVEIISFESERQMDLDNIIGIILPFIAGFLFMISINTSGGYLLQAVVEEKENRTMEIILTSSSPTQIMAGKILGNLSVGLTQVIIWILFGLLGVIALQSLIPEMQTSQIDLSFLGLMIITFLPAFVMIAAMMAALGATVTESREAQQISGLFTLPIVAPFWFTAALIESPNSPLAVGLSLFPLTAPISLPLRAAFTDIPTWQIIFTVTTLIVLAIASLWLAGRAFRLGMLRYGKKLSLKELFRKG